MCLGEYTWRSWKVLLRKCWFEVRCEQPFCLVGRAFLGTWIFMVICCGGQAHNVWGHVLVDPSVCLPYYAKIVLFWKGAPCPSELSMLDQKWIDSLVRELVVCHSSNNACVSRMRPRGHDLWFLTATCKGYVDTRVPSTLRASRFVFPRRYQNRWSVPDVWEPKEFDLNCWIRWLGRSGALLRLVDEESYVKDCTRLRSFGFWKVAKEV